MPLVEIELLLLWLLVVVGDSFFECGGDRLEKPPNADQGDIQVANPRKSLEQEYLDYETKVRFAALFPF